MTHNKMTPEENRQTALNAIRFSCGLKSNKEAEDIIKSLQIAAWVLTVVGIPVLLIASYWLLWSLGWVLNAIFKY